MLSWLGIGAQRSGTTWFTDLMLQHPGCSLGRSGQKELHILDRAVDHGDLGAIRQAYASEFEGVDAAIGEWTPSYLRALWAPALAAEVVKPGVVLVLLRDPIERFHSAVRLNESLASKRRPKRPPDFLSARMIEAQWASHYLPQLEAWADAVGRDRMLVMQYEAVVENPVASVAQVWERIGLDATPLEVPPLTKASPSTDGFGEIDGVLARSLASQLEGLQAWGIDLDRWKRLRGNLG